ncbi:nitric oxide-associated protein 1-like [Argonauta hians]
MSALTLLRRFLFNKSTLNISNTHRYLIRCWCNLRASTHCQNLKLNYDRELFIRSVLTRSNVCLDVPDMTLCRKYRRHRRKMKQKSKEEEEQSESDDLLKDISLITQMYMKKENLIKDPLLEPTEISRPNKDDQMGLSDVFYTSETIQKLLKAYEELDCTADEIETFLQRLRLSIKTYEDPRKKETVSFGIEDPSIAVSNVNCPGCGAILHCQDKNRAGYISSKKFLSLTPEKLERTFCFRCVLMKYHNYCLNMKVPIEHYPSILSHIQDSRAIVLFTVDMTDLNNSLIKDILPIIGHKRPVYIIGNKVDLIPMDSPSYLNRMRKYLHGICSEAGWNPVGHNIRHIALVSAKTGYGIEDLITKLFKDYKKNGDIYLVGSANVGKSSLFNILLQSDLCKSQAQLIFQKATVSVWPGTTLDLLKFPVLSPGIDKMYKRKARLMEQAEMIEKIEVQRRVRLAKTGQTKNAVLRGFFGMTKFVPLPDEEYGGFDQPQYTSDKVDASIKPVQETSKLKEMKAKQLEQFKANLNQNHWFYDTPGVINKNQITSYLTPEELQVLLSCKMFRPRTFLMKPNQTMFVSGLGRIDYTEGTENVLLTLVNNNNIKVHYMNTSEAEDFYRENIGTGVLQIPLGDEDRLRQIPPLVGNTFHITGTGWKQTVCDIVLSSVGWFGVSSRREHRFTLCAYTPGGHGCVSRPPLLPNAVNLKSKRIQGTPKYGVSKCLSLVKLPPLKLKEM